jgi:hypothetical protein
LSFSLFLIIYFNFRKYNFEYIAIPPLLAPSSPAACRFRIRSNASANAASVLPLASSCLVEEREVDGGGGGGCWGGPGGSSGRF